MSTTRTNLCATSVSGMTWRAKRLAAVVACALALPASADWNPGDGHKMHYPQLPDPNGWDVAATQTGQSPDYVNRRVADDWQCSESGPVTDIHFWGSWKNGIKGEIDYFCIGIWRDDPVGADGYIIDNPYSTPIFKWWDPILQGWVNGERWFWCVYQDAGEFTERLYASGDQGWYDPHTNDYIPVDHTEIYQYNIQIPDWLSRFEQEVGEIYWLVIDAHLKPTSPPGSEWGWKTSLDHWNDDATYYDSRIPVPAGYPHAGSLMPDWQELRDPPGASLDMAFVITGEPPPDYKWLQEPDLTTTGMDINSSLCMQCHTNPPGGHKLADDFECTERSPITEIRVWGSWQNDYLPYGNDPAGVDFYLSIHEDIPAKPPSVPYSRPGAELWGRMFYPADYTVRLHATDIEEWWYQPPYISDGFAYFPGDTKCYEYIFDIGQSFTQWGLPDRPVTYWLDVEAWPSDTDAFFGWKTSLDHWNDDAVYIAGAGTTWYELRYPDYPIADPAHPYAGESIDLAFGIVGGDPVVWQDHVVCEPQPAVHPPTYWYEVTPDTFGRCDFHVRVYDPDPCNYSNWVMPANWVSAVHQAGDEWWVSWWDPTPGCKNAFSATTTFGFDNSNQSTWGDWATSIGNSPDPYDPGNIVDTSASHSTETDGYGYRVHVPTAPSEPEVKWVQAPDMSVLGMDVSASRNPSFEHYWLGDDFRCTTTGELAGIVVWGSWLNDVYPSGADGAASPGDSFFDLAIHADVPADQSPTGYSMPGKIVWSHRYFPLDFGGGPFQVELCADGLEEGWYEPTYPATGLTFPGDTECWKYTFTIPAANPFTQQGTPGQPVIYWLTLQALPFDPMGGGQCVFGWKNSIDHWNDDAVHSWHTPFDDQHNDWYEIVYPPTHPLYQQGHPYAGESVDLAFAIIEAAAGPPPPTAASAVASRFIEIELDAADTTSVAIKIRNKCSGGVGWVELRDVDYDDGPAGPNQAGGPVNVGETMAACSDMESYSPATWLGTGNKLVVTGSIIWPDTDFEVWTVSGSCASPSQSATSVTSDCTWVYGDCTGDGFVFLASDILMLQVPNMAENGIPGWTGPHPGYHADVQNWGVPDGAVNLAADVLMCTVSVLGGTAWVDVCGCTPCACPTP